MAANKSQQLGPRIVIMVRMAIFVAPRRTMRRRAGGLPCFLVGGAAEVAGWHPDLLVGRVKSLDGDPVVIREVRKPTPLRV